MAKQHDPDNEPQDFATMLAEFGHGATNKQATEKLREVVQACVLTGRKGSITVKLEIGSAGGLAEIRATISTKRPEAPLPGQHYFSTPEGTLHEEDPRQLKLPTARVLDITPIKDINK